jgi:hypothetical protein
LFKNVNIGLIQGWNVSVKVTFERVTNARKARNPPKHVKIKGRNFVAKGRK